MSVLVPEGVIDSLLRRVAALEGQPAPSGESYVPNYLTVDQQGRVGAEFSGVIKALGVNLPESANPAPGPPNKVQWNRANGATDPTGAPPAQIAAAQGLAPARDSASLGVSAISPSTEAEALLGAQNYLGGSGSTNADVICRADLTFAAVLAQATSGGGATSLQPTIIDTLGRSNFVQLGSVQNLLLNLGATGFATVAATGWQKIVTALDTGFRNLCRLGVTPISGSGALVAGHVAIGTGTTGIYDLWGNVTQAGQVSFDWHAFGN